MPTDLSILFIDPWWFNEKVSAGGGMHQLEYPTGVSIDHLIESLKLLKKGNWIKLSFENDHLGIAAILTQQGYGPDGSNNYTKYVSKDGRKTDIRFEDTIYRIKDSKYPFQTIDRPTPNLIIRACSAIKNISKKTNNLILVAPPFAPTVSDALLNSPQNAYMEKAYESLEECLGIKIHDYLYTSNAYDCEFLDGFHGGDTTYARIILDLFLNKDINSRLINADFLEQFIRDESGFASGFTRHQFQQYPEVDFLQLGCQKS